MKKTFFLLATVILMCSCGTLESKYANSTTAQLKLRREQCVEVLNSEKKSFDFKFGSPMALAMMGDGGRKDRIKEKEEIENELLRRYEAGDRQAYLPMFGDPR
jgi:hypothetical protein